VGRVVAEFGTPLEGRVDFASLVGAARQVATVRGDWQPFEQQRWSNRKLQRYEVAGVTGGGVFADVPAALLPWLVWGGRLGAGRNRVAGGGAWRTVLA
jgi:hypothetical protein